MKPEEIDKIIEATILQRWVNENLIHSGSGPVIRAALKAAGYAIVLNEAQLLEKGAEAGVKIHD